MTRSDAIQPKALISNILQQLNDEVLSKLTLAGGVRHPGEGGRARENIIGDALRQFVPDSYGVGTGFVIDALGQKSRQVDLIIFRRGYHPVFVVGGISHYMIESVVAVIEHKAAIRNRADLRDALATLRSVKALDRTNRGTNYVVHGTMMGEMVTTTDSFHVVHGAILTESSLAMDSVSAVIVEYLAANERHLWPNMYVDLSEFVGYYLDASLSLTDKPSEAVRWVLTTPKAPGGHAPFIEYLSALTNYLRVAPLVDFKPTGYLPTQVAPGRSWPVPPMTAEEPPST